VSLVDYTLVPDIAIVDPNLTLTMPPVLTADTGIDALTHALEAGVSIFATPYTDAFCVQAARLIFDALPKAFADGSDLAAREAMANASTIAGLAFANAFVGVNHALAHAVGARFGLSHGRVNGVFLPHVMRYNAALPTKFMPAPGYGAYIAPEKYATLGLVLFGGRGPEEQRRRLFTHVDELLVTVGIPRTLREAGIAEEEFEAAIPDLLRLAFEDPSIRTNPRMPLLNELESLLRAAYGAEPSRR
jgi:acetaldehyde dehydrogenase/alcohol dehydrogenase